ncbi:MAG: sterol desaturase family protein [Anaerolineae bacterium]|nr:sterol desaturase family protein [Thermoflexales bacterium]MDW8408682.1 sterol desaturase family protein [Anaerolineae bacterium]
MKPTEINHSAEPIRLFKSDFLEFFTHIHPAVVVAIWLPVSGYFLAQSITALPAGASALHIPLGFVAGLFVWTLTEYAVHRFVFHYEPRDERMKRIFFLFHGVHHAQPQCKTRLVMPPAVSIPGGILVYGLFSLLLGGVLGAPHWVAPIFSGFVLGYLIYDMIHYATHHLPMYGRVMKYLKRYHMLHHFKTPEKRYGVSSPLWDFVFRTAPPE